MEGQKRRKSDEEDRVERIYKPTKQIVMLDYFQFSKDSLIQMFAKIVHSGLSVMAQWVRESSSSTPPCPRTQTN